MAVSFALDAAREVSITTRTTGCLRRDSDRHRGQGRGAGQACLRNCLPISGRYPKIIVRLALSELRSASGMAPHARCR